MSLGLATSLMQMPTARHLLSQILGDLRHGHSVLGLLPEGVDPNLLGSALWDDLGYSDLRIDEVFIPQLDAQTPAAALAQALGVVWGASTTPRTVDNLLKQADLPEIIFLDGFDELAEEDRDQWLRFVVRWAQVCQGRQSTGEDGSKTPPALCLLTQASKVSHPPSTNVYLSIQVWRGIPTTLEMRLLCRLASGQDSAPLSRWKEHTIPAIAGSDLGLGDYLWAHEYRTGTQLAHILRTFARERGWDRGELEVWPVHNLPHDTIDWLESWPLSPDLYQAWAQGMVHWTPEYGLECHSAVLALLDRQEALDHRLWRGQAGFLLPQIDETRLALCDHLNRSYGQDWPYKWQKPKEDRDLEDVINTPFACQWGHLKYLLQHRELSEERRWQSLVNCSWRIRTQLAHYRPIALRDYEKFCSELELLSRDT